MKINIIDTPGHADFGGEVERVLRMADGALVLVDAAEGPMPQTRFVLSKALECRLRPVIVINKIDRPDARPHEVIDEVFELFLQLGAEDALADFPYIFTSAKLGYATHDLAETAGTVAPLMDMILEQIPGPGDRRRRPAANAGDHAGLVGLRGPDRHRADLFRLGPPGPGRRPDAARRPRQPGADRLGPRLRGPGADAKSPRAEAGDIVALVGLENVEIGDTVSDPQSPRALPRVVVDEPTLKMTFGVNTSPLAGQEGRFLTSRHLRERLLRELQRNVALRVEPIPGTEQFSVAGRGILHLSVLIETMRREGYELSVGKPQVILHHRGGVVEEPFESLVVEVPEASTGAVMELVGQRRGQLVEMTTHNEYTYLLFSIPARGLIGLRTRLLNATQGTAVIHHRFDRYRPMEADIPGRATGVLVSNSAGRGVAYGLDTLQQRAEMHVGPGDVVYEGMIVGENSRSGDMTVNPTKEKKLSNMRAVGHDRNILLKPARRMSLEEALEFIADDELVEVTPTQIRLRKIILKEVDRRRADRAGTAENPGGVSR